MAKAKWTTKRTEVVTTSAADGSFTAAVPLYDNAVLAATLRFTLTADRVLTVRVENEPGAAGLSGFQAWEV